MADARPAPDGRRLRAWLGAGYQASMAWMENPAVRENPAALLEGAASVVMVGWNTWAPAAAPGPGEGRIARYALRPDYHRFMRKRLRALLRAVQALAPCRGRICVDAQPLLERAFARDAGLGWTGKHACLISPQFGSWLLLGALILDLPLAPDEPHPNRCGSCARCVPACPTGAIVAPGVIDANRCIAYLTIEHRGPIPEALRPAIGTWLFGCDLCQEACPWDRFAQVAEEPPARLAGVQPATDFLAHSDESFRAAYAGTPLMRAGRARMARNAAVVLGNLGDPAAVPFLTAAHAGDPDPVVREHAGWALRQLAAHAATRTTGVPC